MTICIQRGTVIDIYDSKDVKVDNILKPGTYTVYFDEGTNSFRLKEAERIDVKHKIYGNSMKRTERIISTFNDRTSSTGVMLAGSKGSGKTLLAKLVSRELYKQGIPTLVVNEAYSGTKFNTFIQSINQPVLVLFDEFEKNYSRNEQDQLLTLLDGTVGGKKMYIITTNESYYLSDFYVNRPGRFYYSFTYKGIEEAFIKEYCKDNLKDKSRIQSVVDVSGSFDEFSFDILQAMVEEMNRYDESVSEVLEYLNASPARGSTVWEMEELETPDDIEGNLDDYRVSINYDNSFNPFNDTTYVRFSFIGHAPKSARSLGLSVGDECVSSSSKPLVKAKVSGTSHDDLDSLNFYPDEITKVENGIITFESEGYVLKIKKVERSSANISKLF